MLTLKEIALIDRIRKFDFGIIEVHKAYDGLIRTIEKKNELIKDEEGIKVLNQENKK